VFNTNLYEFLTIIFGFIKPNHMSHIEMFEHLKIIFRRIASSVSPVIQRSHECNEFAWNDPVHVSILYFLIIIVLFRIEVLKLIPSMLNGNLKSFQTMEYLQKAKDRRSYSAFVLAVPI